MARLVEAICTHALGEYRDKGFKAYESDDHILVLEHDGEVIIRFNASKATIEELQQACHQHLNEHTLCPFLQFFRGN